MNVNDLTKQEIITRVDLYLTHKDEESSINEACRKAAKEYNKTFPDNRPCTLQMIYWSVFLNPQGRLLMGLPSKKKQEKKEESDPNWEKIDISDVKAKLPKGRRGRVLIDEFDDEY